MAWYSAKAVSSQGTAPRGKDTERHPGDVARGAVYFLALAASSSPNPACRPKFFVRWTKPVRGALNEFRCAAGRSSRGFLAVIGKELDNGVQFGRFSLAGHAWVPFVALNTRNRKPSWPASFKPPATRCLRLRYGRCAPSATAKATPDFYRTNDALPGEKVARSSLLCKGRLVFTYGELFPLQSSGTGRPCATT